MTLHELFARQVARTPTAAAIVEAAGTTLSYARLNELVDWIADRLAAEGVGLETPVGLLVDRSVWLPAAVLGILRAGGVFVPLDPSYPTARLRQILQSTGACVTLVDSGRGAVVREAGGAALELGPDLPSAGFGTGCPPVAVDPMNLAAIYHTSGSTGTPKGVACTHAGWVGRMEWMQRRHQLQPGETVLQKSVITFDDSALEFLWPLLVGGKVALLAPGDAHLDPRAVIEATIRHEVTHLQFVPSLLDVFLDALTDEDVAALGQLRSAGTSGEALHLSLAHRFHQRFGGRITLDNTWGVTEASIDSTHYACPYDGPDAPGTAPIGVEMDGATVHVLDERLRPIPAGELGELCIGGPSLARGYIGDPARTAAVFVPDPTVSGARMYRTGDRGRRDTAGTLTFIGRSDDQVKIRGVRIELGEIEAALRMMPGVQDAVATTWEPGGDGKRLAAYVVPTAVGTLDGERVRGHLRTLLPIYAIPDFIGVLAELPRHPNGKTRRSALPLPGFIDAVGEEEPVTETERILRSLWTAVLGVDSVGIRTHFLDVGGNSLIATRLLSRLRRTFELRIPLRFVFEHPTIKAAAEQIEAMISAEIGALPQQEAPASR